jgi:hypothetical protein
MKKTQHPQEQPAGASGSKAGMVSGWGQTREEENGRKETIGRKLFTSCSMYGVLREARFFQALDTRILKRSWKPLLCF